MTQTPSKPQISVAHAGEGDRLHAPAAERNADALLALLQSYAPATGLALELASGSGQHVSHFARHLPGLVWQPTEVDAARLRSIAAWAADAPPGRILEPQALDATRPGWSTQHHDLALITLVNLMHLISTPAARTLISEVAKALAPNGRFILYGPFLRDGKTTSDGDARFHASIRAQDPELGYKNDADLLRWGQEAGLTLMDCVDMPANNLAFILERPKAP